MDVTRSPGERERHLCRNFCIDCPQCGMTLHFTEHTRASPARCPLYSHCVLYSQFIEIHHSPQGGAEVPRPHFYQSRPRISRGTKLMERFVFVTDWERRVTRVTPFLFCVYIVCYMLQSYIMDIVHIMYSSCNICHNLYDSRLNQF